MMLLLLLVILTGVVSWVVDRQKPPSQVALFCRLLFVVVSVLFVLLLLQDPGGINLSGLR